MVQDVHSRHLVTFAEITTKASQYSHQVFPTNLRTKEARTQGKRIRSLRVSGSPSLRLFSATPKLGERECVQYISYLLPVRDKLPPEARRNCRILFTFLVILGLQAHTYRWFPFGPCPARSARSQNVPPCDHQLCQGLRSHAYLSRPSILNENQQAASTSAAIGAVLGACCQLASSPD